MLSKALWPLSKTGSRRKLLGTAAFRSSVRTAVHEYRSGPDSTRINEIGLGFRSLRLSARRLWAWIPLLLDGGFILSGRPGRAEPTAHTGPAGPHRTPSIRPSLAEQAPLPCNADRPAPPAAAWTVPQPVAEGPPCVAPVQRSRDRPRQVSMATD